jgi:STE24 endopeptidase
MPSFDPAAATAAYLATLTPAQHAQAIAYTHGGEWLLLWGWLVGIVSALIILRSGLLVRLRARIERDRPRRNLAVFVVLLAFVVLSWLIELPWSIYADWGRERGYGLTKQAFGGWLGENLLSSAISALLTALLAIAIYALIRRLPRSWWAWSGGVCIAAIVFLLLVTPAVIEPLFNTYTPAPHGPTRDAVVALAARSGVPSDKIYIYDGSKQSERYTANVSGLFGSARVAMSDTMFAQGADIAEVRAVVGHEMGHYAHKHILIDVIFLSLIAVAMLWATDRLFPAVAARVPGGKAIAGIANPAGAPVFAIVITTIGLVITPLMSAFTRYSENDADVFSLAHAHEPDGLARALVKTIEYRAASPSWIEEMVFYDHPSVSRRIQRAMVWRAAHPELVGK